MKEFTFIAFDVEIATASPSSICQIGYVKVINNSVVEQESFLVQPPDNEYFARNSCIHGIDALMTKDKPLFPEIWQKLQNDFTSYILVAHNASFDISALSAAIELYKMRVPRFNYECTYHSSGLKLTALCEALEIGLYQHHNALSDALACADAFIKLKNGIRPNYSLIRDKEVENIYAGHERITGNLLRPDLESGDKDHAFHNKKIVFTGVLDKISRDEAAKVVKSIGADIDTGISKNTNYVIVGHGAGPAKLKKIEDLNSKGSNIKMLNENDFLDIIKHGL